jgi:hypothetical protein
VDKGQSLIISFLKLLSMALSQKDLLKLALNLQDPWYIKSIEFSKAEKRIDINIDFGQVVDSNALYAKRRAMAFMIQR